MVEWLAAAAAAAAAEQLRSCFVDSLHHWPVADAAVLLVLPSYCCCSVAAASWLLLMLRFCCCCPVALAASLYCSAQSEYVGKLEHQPQQRGGGIWLMPLCVAASGVWRPVQQQQQEQQQLLLLLISVPQTQDDNDYASSSSHLGFNFALKAAWKKSDAAQLA